MNDVRQYAAGCSLLIAVLITCPKHEALRCVTNELWLSCAVFTSIDSSMKQQEMQGINGSKNSASKPEVIRYAWDRLAIFTRFQQHDRQWIATGAACPIVVSRESADRAAWVFSSGMKRKKGLSGALSTRTDDAWASKLSRKPGQIHPPGRGNMARTRFRVPVATFRRTVAALLDFFLKDESIDLPVFFSELLP